MIELDEYETDILQSVENEEWQSRGNLDDRTKELQQDIADIDSGKMEMLSQEQYDKEINSFFTDLKSKYEN